MERSTDEAAKVLLRAAEREAVGTIWDRFQMQSPQCGFGELGVCCRNCMQGPCRISPFGEGPTEGACGATADTIVARNLARSIAAGTAAHSGHAKHLVHTLLKWTEGKAPDYPVRDEPKLRSLAARVGVSSEGKTWYKLCQADIFIVGLLATSTFGLLWSATQGSALGWVFFSLFLLSSTVLFSTVLWSKFAHMFFKPAAAYQKKITRADGSQENLPDLGELTDPALQARYPDIPEYMGTNPPYMGLGIKRERPNHY